MKDYITLLQSDNVLRRLSFIQLISYFGAWFSNVAIYTLLLQMGVNAEVVAFVAMLHFLAGVVQAPLSGAVIDTISPKKLMLALLSVEIIATLLLLFVNNHNDLMLLYVCIFIKMAAASFYFTTEMSLLPKILAPKNLQKANEIHSIIWSFSYTLGMAVSGFVVYSLGVHIAFVLDALMFMIAIFLLVSLPLNVEKNLNKVSLFMKMRETFSYIKETPKAFHLMVVHAFVGLTAFDALVALMVEQYYASFIATALALGLLHSFRAIGLVIGPMVLGRHMNNKRLILLFIAQALAIWLWGWWMESFYLSLVASVVVGFFTTTLWSYTYTLLQKNIKQEFYGRIVAYNDMLFLSTAAATSYAIGYFVAHQYSLEFITLLMGVGFCIGALYYSWVVYYQKIEEIGV